MLTEPRYFHGHDDYLTAIRKLVDIPLLRKDFIVDDFQIRQSAQLGADAILLICAILSPSQLAEYHAAATEMGLSCLVEVHDEAEIEMALSAKARIIGVNNRDLRTFKVDTNNSIRLRKRVPADIVFVSESGIRTAGDIACLQANNVDAVLIGETLMRAPDIKTALNELRGSTI